MFATSSFILYLNHAIAVLLEYRTFIVHALYFGDVEHRDIISYVDNAVLSNMIMNDYSSLLGFFFGMSEIPVNA